MTKLALALNTKVVHDDILSMFKKFLRPSIILCSGHSMSYPGQHMKYYLSAWSWDVAFMNKVPFVNLSVANVF